MRGEPAAEEASMMLQPPEVHHVFSWEVVPGSQDPGSGRLHRLPGEEVWIVSCACIQASWWLQHSLSISCRSLVSLLIATARAHLWSSFRRYSAFCGQTGKESPLLAHPETMVSCLLGRSRLFPGLPPG